MFINNINLANYMRKLHITLLIIMLGILVWQVYDLSGGITGAAVLSENTTNLLTGDVVTEEPITEEPKQILTLEPIINETITIRECEDKTPLETCSKQKPKYCKNGTLVRAEWQCGCSESCGNERTLKYVLRGKEGFLKINVDKTIKETLQNKSRLYYDTTIPPYDKAFELKFINEPEQKETLQEILAQIKQATTDKFDRVRIAISITQNIPYDYEGAANGKLNNKFPYEVLYDMNGVCGEKTRLLAYLLKELGMGVAMIRYDEQNHQAVGILCPLQYSLENSGYCFVETTKPAIATDNTQDYAGYGKLTIPRYIPISDGVTFSGIREEYNDAQKFIESKHTDSELKSKYGIN